MASHFKWYPSSEEVIVPWNARYSYPSQANKALKMTPRIPPKNGASFLPGNVIRVEFPAQGYVNPLNTTLEFDVLLYGSGDDTENYNVRFQNNIQSIFQRVRLLYGSTPLEDIVNYNVIVRNLTEWTGTNQQGTMDQCSIADGIGGVTSGLVPLNTGGFATTLVNVRQNIIQGIDMISNTSQVIRVGAGYVPNRMTASGVPAYTIRRYQINFALGLFTQDKLVRKYS